MPHNRYFVPGHWGEGSELIIEETEFHHMTRVMRQKVSDRVELINGAGNLAIASIQSIDKHKAALRIEELHQEKREDTSLILCLAYLRPSNLELACEKCTELGVDAIWLFPAQRSEKKELSDSQKRRLEQILIASTKQCGRLFLPAVEYHKTFADCLKSAPHVFFGDLDSTSSYSNRGEKTRSIIIGPESGFSDAETAQLRASTAAGIRLSPNILRAETAAIAAIILLKNS